MHHLIELTVDLTINVESSFANCLERLVLFKGTQLRAQIKPYAVETDYGFVEVADLSFGDEVAIHGVPFACFFFVD